MARNDISTPAGALPVTTYSELEDLARQFVAGHYSLLMVLGHPGLGKSQTVKHAIGNRKHAYMETHSTAFGMYCQLHKHRGEPIIIDDLDHINSDSKTIALLKSLCNTDRSKTLRWLSKHPDIGEGSGQVPPEFRTTSPVCLIANEWRTLNANVRAIEDRAIILQFEPTVGEVHVEVRKWFEDREVYEFIEDHLRYITQPSMRFYVKGDQLKRADPEKWRDRLLAIMNIDEKVRAIVQLLSAPGFATEAERVAEFTSQGFGDRATYYRWKKKLIDAGREE
jgi:hypothetical protein